MNPHLNVDFNSREFISRIRTNSLGFRDDEESIHHSEVLLLGDSFAFGWGVQKEEACESLLETLLSRKVLNMGISGYSTVQEYLLLRRHADVVGATGKTAVFLFCENDFMDNAAPIVGMLPSVRKIGREVRFSLPTREAYDAWVAPRERGFLKAFGEVSRVGGLIDYSYQLMSHSTRVKAWNERHETRSAAEGALSPYETFEYLVREIRAFAGRKEMKIAFARIPDFTSLAISTREEEWLSKFRAILWSLSIPLIELDEALSPEDHFARDPHWNARGHSKVARLIEKFLKENGWVRSPENTAASGVASVDSLK